MHLKWNRVWRLKAHLLILLLWTTLLPAAASSPAMAQPSTPASATTVAATVSVKVMVIIYNPIIESREGRRLTDVLGWNSADALTAQFVQDIATVSHGAVNYQVTRRVERDEWPICRNGNRYTDAQYLAEWEAGTSRCVRAPASPIHRSPMSITTPS